MKNTVFVESFKNLRKVGVATTFYDIVQYFLFHIVIALFLICIYLFLPYEQVIPTAQEINQYISENNKLPPLTLQFHNIV